MTNEDVLVQVNADKPFFAGDADSWRGEFNQFQAISDRANGLLSREEGFDVAFRKSILVLESDDLVSFANSKNGGTILIGVGRIKSRNSRQGAAVLGCPVGDKDRLKILIKSSQCVPPVPVFVFAENCAENPFYRIEIPSGPHKPYCTSGGTYKIRGDGRNEMLYPDQLLALFLESGGEELVRWFHQAATSLGTAPEGTGRRVTEAPAEASAIAEGDAREAAIFSQRTEDRHVELSSQDLCGFLMRLS
jgi:hypothetical protein